MSGRKPIIAVGLCTILLCAALGWADGAGQGPISTAAQITPTLRIASAPVVTPENAPAVAAVFGDEAPTYRGPRQGGETCALAVPIPALPFADTGTTVGHLNDYDAACPATSAAADVVYALQPSADVQVDISLCHAGTAYDTKLYVYQNLCQGVPLACNDEACPGHKSVLAGLQLTGGVTYFIVIDGYGTQAGPYELTVSETPPLPACPDDAVFGQPAEVDSAMVMGISDLAAGYLRYESYSAAHDIWGLRVWGVTLHWSGSAWSACDENPMPLRVKFYEDEAGLPGAVVSSTLAHVVPVDTGWRYTGYPICEFFVRLGTPCTLHSGWFSVQGEGDPTCWFLWNSSTSGDGKSLFQTGSGTPVWRTYDLSVCLLGAGACCVSDGTCCVLLRDDCRGLRRGDLDCDGLVGFSDINPFVLAISNPAGYQQTFPNCPPVNGDANADCTVGFGDISPFVSLLTTPVETTTDWLGLGTLCADCGP